MSSEPLVGKLLGHFLLLEQIGAGGMGVVYRAHDERLNRDVAIKVLPAGSLADDNTRKRFQQEAQALARLNHPNIATVFDFDCQGTTDFLVMELLTRQTLADKLLSGPLPVNIVIKYGMQMAEGLAAAHQQGILHRDLKPGNLGLTAEGRVKLLDFGLAKLLKTDPVEVTQSMTGAGLAKGTLAYMAPEQLRGENIDTRVDIYAAGSVLYEMATAKRPHPQESGPLLVDAILNHLPAQPSSLNRNVTPALEAVILKALEKEPNSRYQTAQELAADLEHLQTATVPVALRQASRRRFRRLLRPAVAAAGVLFLAIVAWQVSRRLQVHTITGVRPMLLVGDFENSTGEPVFDSTLREMFTSSLEQSHLVQVFPTSRLVDVLQRMQRPPTQRIDESVGREICLREGLKGLLVGSIARFGRAYVLLVRIKSPSGSDIITAKASTGSADDIPAKVDEIAETVRRKLGESLQSLKENSVPLAEVSSSSLDAVRYFTLGKQSLYNGDPSQAVLMFSKALELDPNFAMAHEYLGAGYEYLNQYDRDVEELRRAAQLADRVSEPERLRIMAAYYASELDFQKECENYQLLAQLQPLDPSPFINLGVCKKETYDYTAAVSFTEQAIQLVPNSDVRINLAADLLSKGDTEKALQVAQPLSREFANNLFEETVLGRIYVALGRFEDARRTWERMAHTGPDAEIEAELSLADLDLATGQYADAEKKLQAAIQSAERNHNRFSAAKGRITLAEMLLQKGASLQASQQLAQVDLPPHAPALALLLSRTYAWTGRLQAANQNLREIDALINQRDVPALQALRYLTNAEIALAQRRPADAVQAAEGALNYQKSVLAIETLARCYAAAGKHEQAAEKYQVLLTRANELLDDTRMEGFDEPAFRRAVDAHYRLGVLYQKLGRWGDSRTELQKFLNYWSHADAELEIYKDAQRLLKSLPPSGVPTPAT
jgi:serine/threonine protein kinase/tetratricopeptide (TPR) repeat protein